MDVFDIEWARISRTVLAVAVAATAIVVTTRELGALQVAELRLHDRAVATFARPELAPDVTIISVDDEALETWGWPLPDETLAALINAATEAGARVVGVDIYRDRPVGRGQDALVAAFETTGAIGIFSLGSNGLPGIAPPVATQALGTNGFSDMLIDDDGVARRALLVVSDDAGPRMSFALRLALAATGQTRIAGWSEDPQIMTLGHNPIPRLVDGFGPYRGLDDAGYQMMIDYNHALPIATIVGARDLLVGTTNADVLNGKVAIIGTASDAVKDHFRTPLSRGGNVPFVLGAQVHAAIVQHLIDTSQGNFTPLRSPEWKWQVALILAAALLAGMLSAIFRKPLAILLVGPGLALTVGLVLTAAIAKGLWLPALPVALAWVGSALATSASLRMLEWGRHRAVTRLFSDHLSPALAAQVWRNRDVILNGGKPTPMRLYSTVLFADLAGSTAIGGGAEPQAFMVWVSDYLDMISDIATRHGGFVEKFTGDGIMIVFGAPLPSVEDAARRRDAEAACRCAWAIAEATRDRNNAGMALALYRVRIGIHSGPVFGGTIGNRGSMRYNVMGDTVNIAARIEAFGKKSSDRPAAGQMICLSGTTAELARNTAIVAAHGTLLHDDGQTAFEIYRLLGVSD